MIAANKSVEEIRRFIRADSLGYLSLEGLQAAVGDPESYCTACYTNDYPLEPEREKAHQAGLFDVTRR